MYTKLYARCHYCIVIINTVNFFLLSSYCDTIIFSDATIVLPPLLLVFSTQLIFICIKLTFLIIVPLSVLAYSLLDCILRYSLHAKNDYFYLF